MSDILIVGGGLTGLLAAREFCLAGAKVVVMDKGPLASESSWAGGGIISPLYPWHYVDSVSALVAWSQSHFSQLSHELHEHTGLDPEYEVSGLITVTDETAEAERWAIRQGKSYSILSESETKVLEPLLGVFPSGNFSGVYDASIGQIRNPRFLKALIRSLELMGVQFRPNEQVKGLDVRSGVVSSVLTGTETVSADIVVLACGAWTSVFEQGVTDRLKVEPVKGQMLLFKTEPRVIKHIVMMDGHYVIPRRDGHVLVGSTVEYAGFDKQSSEEGTKVLMAAAEKIIPKLASYPLVKQWAGLRPGSVQGVPYIGEHPNIRGLFVSAGHFRNGVVMGPASARLLRNLVLNEATIVDSAPYRLDRDDVGG